MGLPSYTPIVPDYSFIARAGQQVAQYIPGIAEAVATLRENRVSNSEMFQGMVAYVDALPDAAVQAMGTTKDQLKATLPVASSKVPTAEYVRKISAWTIPLAQNLYDKGGMSLDQINGVVRALPGALQRDKNVEAFAAGISSDIAQKGITGAAQRAALPNEQAAIGAANRTLATQGETPFDFTIGDPEIAAARKAMIVKREAKTPGVTPQTREEFQGAFGRELAAMPGRPATQEQVEANPVVKAMTAGYIPYKEPKPQKEEEEDKLTAYQRWQMARGNREDEDAAIQKQKSTLLAIAKEINDQEDKIAQWQSNIDLFKKAEKDAKETGDTSQLEDLTKKFGGVAYMDAAIRKIKRAQAEMNSELTRERRVLEKMNEGGRGLTANAGRQAKEERAKEIYSATQELLSGTAPDGRSFRDKYSIGALDDYKALRDYALAKGYDDEVVNAAIQSLREGRRSGAPSPTRPVGARPIRPVGAMMSDDEFEQLNARYGQ